jgi:hypothetical protein
LNTEGFYGRDLFLVEIELNPEKIGSISFLYKGFLFIHFTYLSHPEEFVIGGIIFLLVSIVLGFFIYKKVKYKQKKAKMLKPISAVDTAFSEKTFLQKVEFTANLLNDAWYSGDMKKVRSFVSGGIYNRFRIQLEIMKKQGIKNKMADWNLMFLDICEVTNSDHLITIHVLLKAKSKDANFSLEISDEEIQKKWKHIPEQEYTEYWSFVRSKSAKSSEGFQLQFNQCPNCGADVKNVTDQNKCKHCDAIFNSGEYDWVLSEITQEIEWNSMSSPEIAGWSEVQKQFPRMSRQILEDKASVLFWKWVRCYLEGNQKYLEREIYPSRKLILKEGGEYIRDTAVGSVDLQSFLIEKDYLEAKLFFKWSAAFSENSNTIHKESILTMRTTTNYLDKFGIAELGCESCGAPLPEIDSIQCSYCSNPIPQKVNDWQFYNLEHFI